MKKVFCILSLVFFILCLICGACYGALFAKELILKLKEAKKTTIEKIKDYIAEE